MKFIAILATLISAPAFSTEVEIIETPVYDRIKCLEQSHVGRRDLLVSVDSVNEYENSKSVTLNVEFMTCLEVPGGYGFRNIGTKADMFVFKDKKLVYANKALNYVRFYYINDNNEVYAYDLEKNNDKYQVVVDIPVGVSEFSLGAAINSDIIYNNEVLYGLLIESARPTYLKIK